MRTQRDQEVHARLHAEAPRSGGPRPGDLVRGVPWVPQEPGRWFKPLHFLTASGTWVNLVKMEPDRRIRCHVHTLKVPGDEEMVTLFVVNGVIQYLDDDGNVVQQDHLGSRRKLYQDHCRTLGIEPAALEA